jgi:hypothetical protein
VGYGKDFYFPLAILDKIEDSIIARSYSVAFSPLELFNSQRARIFFQGNKNLYDSIVNLGWETL